MQILFTHNLKMALISEPVVWTKEATTEWVDGKIQHYIDEYRHTEEPQRVNFRALCSQWPWAKRSDFYTHYLHRYPAKLLPYIPIFFLSSSIVGNAPVLDPFAGTGTVAVESIIHFTNPSDCLLVEINPLARLISAAKTTPLDPEILKKKSVELFNIIEEFHIDEASIPKFPGVDFWFRKEAQIGLAVVRDSIKLLDTDIHVKDFFWASFSSIIRDMSRADPKISPPVLLSANKFKDGYKDTVQKKIERKNQHDAYILFKHAVNKNIGRMRELWNAWQHSNKHARIIGHDARSLTYSPYIGKGLLDISQEAKLPQNSIGMVITSPPYINAQKYTRTTKFELWWLGLIEPSSKALGEYDRGLIGTERVFFNEYANLTLVGNSIADGFIEKIYATDRYKAGIVSRYFRDMSESLKEIKRVLKPNGYCILVVGNNLVFKESIPNNCILTEMAKSEGLLPKAMLVDEIRSRGLITKRHETAGIIADEWILLLQKPF
jgi:hypothetical protein